MRAGPLASVPLAVDRALDQRGGLGPAGARADSYRLVMRLTHVFENPAPNATVFSTTMQAWARNPGMSGDAIPCSSKGLLETEIGGMIASRLQ